jgi:hypothetical protein
VTYSDVSEAAAKVAAKEAAKAVRKAAKKGAAARRLSSDAEGLGFGPDGRPLPGFGADGRPLPGFGPDGRPLPGFGADGRPLPGFGADGRPLPGYGPDGRRLSDAARGAEDAAFESARNALRSLLHEQPKIPVRTVGRPLLPPRDSFTRPSPRLSPRGPAWAHVENDHYGFCREPQLRPASGPFRTVDERKYGAAAVAWLPGRPPAAVRSLQRGQLFAMRT